MIDCSTAKTLLYVFLACNTYAIAVSHRLALSTMPTTPSFTEHNCCTDVESSQGQAYSLHEATFAVA